MKLRYLVILLGIFSCKSAVEVRPPAMPKGGAAMMARAKKKAELMQQVSEKVGKNCTPTLVCEKILVVDCQSYLDGPVVYVDARSLETVASCSWGNCYPEPPRERGRCRRFEEY